MPTLVKTLESENGELFAIANGRRILIQVCDANVELYEHSFSVPILGRGNVITSRHIGLLVTFNQKPRCSNDEKFLNSISRFEFQGDFINENGSSEQLYFDNCLLDGNLDLTNVGECHFELKCPQSTIDKIRAF